MILFWQFSIEIQFTILVVNALWQSFANFVRKYHFHFLSQCFLPQTPLVKAMKMSKIPYFSDFECNFRLLGGVFHKCSKSKYHRFHQNNFFGTHFSCEKHPLHVFFAFPPHAILGELRKLHAKIYTFSVKIDREINFQS